MNALQQAATRAISEGWAVVSIDDTSLVLTRKKPMSPVCMILGVLGLLFYVVPGLLILIVGYLARGDKQLVFSTQQADEWLAERARLKKAKVSKGPSAGQERALVMIAVAAAVIILLVLLA